MTTGNVVDKDARMLKQRVAELEGLNRLAQLLLLSAALDIDSVLKGIVEASLSLCAAEKASILLFEPSTKETVKTLVHQANPAESSIEHPVNMAVAGWILEHGTPLLSDNLINGVGLKSAPDRYRCYGAVLAMPLIAEGEVIGIINLVNNAGGSKFDENSLRIATIIGQQAAQFIHNAKLQETLFEENRRLRQELHGHTHVHGIIGVSEGIKRVREMIPIVARSTATVLLTGETGTGKEIIARAIHFQSDRAEKPFVAINCSAIPAALVESELFGYERGAFTGASIRTAGKFELANGGTVFLDEIAEMPLDLQPKLLRFLEERKFFRLGSTIEQRVDLHVIAATNRNIEALVHEGKFREDLFYRLNVMPIILPSLRDRPEDIPILAQHFLDEFSNQSMRFTPAALDLLSHFHWKGNIRELRNAVERISLLITKNAIDANDLETLGIGKMSVHSSSPSPESSLASLIQSQDGKTDLLEESEKILVQLALRQADGNVSEAARLLGIDRKTMDRRREKYRL